jgi:hypothetical protein
VELEASVPSPPSEGYRIEWNWGDGVTTEQLGLTTASHEYEAAANYDVVATLTTNAGRKLAVDTVRVLMGESVPAWRITAFADQDNLLSDEEIGGSGPFVALLERLISSPGSGLLAVEAGTGSGTQLRLRVRNSGVWEDDDCCPLPAPSGGELVQVLGTDPSTPHSVGPFFAGWNTDFWSQTTTDLASGTVTAQQALGHATYQIKDGGNQVGPAGGLRLEATRAGTAMTGVLTVTIWWWNEDTGEVEDPGEVYRFPFQAVRYTDGTE